MKTKIIATIGPASYKLSILKKMQKNGMDVARVNTKYMTERKFKEIYPRLKKLKKTKILFDIKNTEVIKWIDKYPYEYLAVSFASSVSQIKKIKEITKKDVKIIAKIESEKGVKNFKSILKASDGIMVARGDLAKNVPFEKIPLIQKEIIKECNKNKKISITATEMLLSLMNSKSPEKSEISDIANAVFDKSNMLMLSEETAIGKYPSLAVKVMSKIIKETEKGVYK